MVIDDDALSARRLGYDAAEEMLLASGLGDLHQIVEQPSALLRLPVVVSLVNGYDETRFLALDDVAQIFLMAVHS